MAMKPAPIFLGKMREKRAVDPSRSIACQKVGRSEVQLLNEVTRVEDEAGNRSQVEYLEVARTRVLSLGLSFTEFLVLHLQGDPIRLKLLMRFRRKRHERPRVRSGGCRVDISNVCGSDEKLEAIQSRLI